MNKNFLRTLSLWSGISSMLLMAWFFIAVNAPATPNRFNELAPGAAVLYIFSLIISLILSGLALVTGLLHYMGLTRPRPGARLVQAFSLGGVFMTALAFFTFKLLRGA